jgi:hypothetical protein
MQDQSTAKFIKIPLEKSNDYEHCEIMDLSRPAILILGGENTNSSTLAYNYAKHIFKTLYGGGIEGGLDIYVTYYKMRDRDSGIDRLNLFKESGVKINPDFDVTGDYLSGTYPKYLHKIYKFAFMPRVFNTSNSRLSFDTAKKNMKKLLVFSHCHGAYVINKISQTMSENMCGFYSVKEIRDIKKQTMTINHAPFAPMGISGFYETSFLSMADNGINHYSKWFQYIKEQPNKFQPAFYKKLGRVMIIDKAKTHPLLEHNISGIASGDIDDKFLTHNGMILFATIRNALLIGADAIQSGEKFPPNAKLLQNGIISYKELTKRADLIYSQMECAHVF